MKATLSLITATAVTALAVGIPTAFADPGLQGAPQIHQAAPDWFERAAAAAERGSISAPYVDAFERPIAVDAAIVEQASSTSSGIEWAQIGIALGLGLVLGLGLMLALRHRPRPMAHQ